MLRAAAGYQAPAPATTDPQFNYVALLLHGDGTNGAQNNTFIDSSSNNFTITRNGNTTQGSLSPYGNLWSNFFDGSGDYLTFPAAAATAFGTNNFTIEAWVYPTTSGTFRYLFDNRNSGQTTNWAFYLTSGNQIEWFTGSAGITGSGGTITANTWNHVAYTRSGTTGRLFLNGAQVGSGTDSTNYSVSSTISYIASRYSATEQFSGSFSNLRIVNGTAVYTSAFTPPTAPLTAITNTSLLTCQSNRFRDASANNFTITRNGDVRVTKDSPFLPTAAYSTSTIGGSGYFDGTDDYLTAPSGTAFNFGSGDFTAECWVYLTSFGSGVRIFGQTDSSGTALSTSILLGVSSGTVTAYLGYGSSSFFISASGPTAITTNAWHHLAVVRNGSEFRVYVNGAQGASTNVSGITVSSSTEPFTVGRNGSYNGFYVPGYVSNLRIVKGTAVYTSAFTPPTAPLTAITNTSLLLNFTNAGIFDNAAENNLETVGNAQISTSVKKYGTGSIAFDGTGDWLLVPDNTNLQLGSGAFTVEGWVNLSLLGSARGLVSKGTSTTGWSLSVNSLNQLVFTDATTAITTTTALMANTWYHIAVVRAGTGTNQTVIYIDGVSSATGTSASNFNQTNPMYIGADRTGGSALNGYIDDLRITKGFARYTAAFTPPTAAFPDQ
jgi:hypothetical protein